MDLDKIETHDQRKGTTVARDIRSLELLAKSHRAYEGLQRLAIVCQNFDQLSVEEAYRLLGPDAFQKEVENSQAYKAWTKVVSIVRIILSVFPLIITWFSMSLAVIGYQHYIDLHQNDPGIPPPFLKLWQDGFPGDPFTFSFTGFLDFGSLVILLVFNVWAILIEYRERSKTEQFAEELRKVTQKLITLISSEGLARITSDAEIERVGRIIQASIKTAYQSSQKLSEQLLDLLDTQIKPVISSFNASINALHQDLESLSQYLNAHQQQMRAFTSTSQEVADASKQLAESTRILATAASQSSIASTSINKEVAALNAIQQSLIPGWDATQQKLTNIFGDTQRQVVIEIRGVGEQMRTAVDRYEISQQKVVSMFSDTQGQMVTQVRGVGEQMRTAADQFSVAASSMRNAATDVRNVGQQLTIINPQRVQQIAVEATNFAEKVKEVATKLQIAARSFEMAANGASGRTNRRPWWRKSD